MGATVRTTADLMPSLVLGERRFPSTALPTIDNIHYQENVMNRDQAKGRIKEVKGKVKEVAGKATGNKDLEQKGLIQNASGKLQAGYGDLKEDLKNTSKG